MLNARVVRVTPRNSESGKVSLQKSDIVDYIEGNLQLLVVVKKGEEVEGYGEFYEGEKLNRLMASAIKNGPIFNESSNTTFYLANR